MIDAEILRMKLNLTECSLDDKQKEEFLTKLDDYVRRTKESYTKGNGQT